MATAQLLDRIQELEGQLPRAQMLGRIGATPSLPRLCRHIARQFASECSVFGRRDLGEAENTGRVWAAKIAQHERQDRRQATTLGDAGRSEGLLQEHALKAVAEEEVDEGEPLDPSQFQDHVQKMVNFSPDATARPDAEAAAIQAAHRCTSCADDWLGQQHRVHQWDRGLPAREAFVQISDNLQQISSVVETNAMLELGLQDRHSTPGLLRDYLERRVPLGTYRLLTQVGYLMAHAYELGARTGNVELKGFEAKGMVWWSRRRWTRGTPVCLGFLQDSKSPTMARSSRPGPEAWSSRSAG